MELPKQAYEMLFDNAPAIWKRRKNLGSGGMARNRKRSSMTLSKLRFLSIVRAELRTEVFTVRRTPNFNMTIPKKERLVAERAADEIAILEVLVARDHRTPPSNQRQLEYLVLKKI
jgi:hypothetical protein